MHNFTVTVYYTDNTSRCYAIVAANAFGAKLKVMTSITATMRKYIDRMYAIKEASH